MNVIFDIIMVMLVLYVSPIQDGWKKLLQTIDDEKEFSSNMIIHYDTIFVGLGVLSFAFVCQHSAFIIAGSLEKPKHQRMLASRTTSLMCRHIINPKSSCGLLNKSKHHRRNE